MTVKEILSQGREQLSIYGNPELDSPALDAALLLAEVLSVRREDLILRDNDPVGEAEKERYLKLIERRSSG